VSRFEFTFKVFNFSLVFFLSFELCDQVSATADSRVRLVRDAAFLLCIYAVNRRRCPDVTVAVLGWTWKFGQVEIEEAQRQLDNVVERLSSLVAKMAVSVSPLPTITTLCQNTPSNWYYSIARADDDHSDVDPMGHGLR
jgi:hypothetical protein